VADGMAALIGGIKNEADWDEDQDNLWISSLELK